MKSLHFLLTLLALLTFSTAEAGIKGIFGEDNRQIIHEPRAALDAIGRVNFSGYNKTRLCTGTLISPDRVITAAHCVFNTRTKKPLPPHQLHFVAGKRLDQFKGHSKVIRVTFLGDYTTNPTPQSDVALLHLATSLKIKPTPLIDKETIENNLLSHILYGKDRPHLPVIDESCMKQRALRPNLWLTSCDTTFGGSGGPVFYRTAATDSKTEWKIAAVMVAIVNGAGSLAVPAHAWRSLLNE